MYRNLPTVVNQGYDLVLTGCPIRVDDNFFLNIFSQKTRIMYKQKRSSLGLDNFSTMFGELEHDLDPGSY